MKVNNQRAKQIRRIGFFLALMLVCMSVMAFTMGAAEEEYTVYIGGVPLSVRDGSAAYLKNDGTTGSDRDYNAKLWYDTQNAVLTLEMNNLVAEGAADAVTPSLQTSAGIYSAYPLTLMLTGENTVSGVGLKEGTYTNAYGMYTKDLTVRGDSTGTLTVTTGNAKGSCYGVYSTGNVTVLGGTLNVRSGSTVDTSSYTRESYGIFARGLVTVGGEGLTPNLRAEAGDSCGESCGIYAYSGITVNSGTTEAVGGYAKNGYADGMLSNRATITITGGNVTASSREAYGGMTTGICANTLVITGGMITATGGSSHLGEEQSAGIYVNYDIDISGGTLRATGGEAVGDVSFGINSWRGNVTVRGDSVVYAHGGTASYSVGLCVERREANEPPYAKAGGDLTIQDNAKVYASTADDNSIKVYSYGIFVGGNLLVQGNPYVQSVAGPVGSMDIGTMPGREKRSFGLYLGNEVYDTPSSTNYVEGGYPNTWETHTVTVTGGTVIAKTLDSDNGILETTDADSQQLMNRSYAVVLYDARLIGFSDSKQPIDRWYQWKIQEQDAFTRSTKEVYPYAEDWQSPTQYFHVEPLSPIYKTVTFKVVNGTWADGSTEDITVTFELKDANGLPDENSTASLTDRIPAGMLPFNGYGNGSWDTVPPATVSGTQNEVYTFTFIADNPSSPVYKTVTFKVVNGTWGDGSTGDITVTLELKDGSASLIGSIPTGMLPLKGYGNGSWDTVPPATVSGTQNEVYTFTFIADNPSSPVYKTVTFKVVNGTWADGSTGDITVTLELKDGSASLIGSIPTGMLPLKGYGNGSWDTVPPATVSGTQNDVYTFTFIPDNPSFPPTSDNGNRMLWFALTFVSGAGGAIMILGVRNRKRKIARK